MPVRGSPRPSYLVSADLTAEAGSYNGPLTIPIEVVGEKLQLRAPLTGEVNQYVCR